MHAQLHEHLVALTTADLQGQLRDTVSHFKDKNLIISSLLENIAFFNSADVYSMTCLRHFRSPDQQIVYIGCRLPQVIIEVSSSQTFYDLRQVAHDSILMTEGNIQMVIGVDIGCKVKNGLIADRLLFWEPVIFPGNPRSLSSVYTFDKVSLQFRPLCELLQA